jgi:hypothetical protein
MCDFASMATAGGHVAEGFMANSMAKYNARIAKGNAAAAVREGNAAGYQTLREFRQIEGAQKASLAKAGVDVGSGTAQQLALDTEKAKQFAYATDLWKGQSERTKYVNQAKLMRHEGRIAMATGAMRGFTSLLNSNQEKAAQALKLAGG